ARPQAVERDLLPGIALLDDAGAAGGENVEGVGGVSFAHDGVAEGKRDRNEASHDEAPRGLRKETQDWQFLEQGSVFQAASRAETGLFAKWAAFGRNLAGRPGHADHSCQRTRAASSCSTTLARSSASARCRIRGFSSEGKVLAPSRRR